MKKILIPSLLAAMALNAGAVRSDIMLKKGWQFSKDSINWQSVTIPHDWAIYGPFDHSYDLQKVAVEQNGETEETWKTGRTAACPM